jgi:hypothetical protein
MDSKDTAAHAQTGRQSDTPNAATPVDMPVGTQTIRVPSDVAAYLQSLPGDRSPRLIGTRVWMKRKKGAFILHMGDVGLGTLED